MQFVSVIIPNFNHAPYLKERIDSVLAQTFQNFEIIILDDKSTDNSKEIIDQYAENEKIVKIIYNDKNSGSTFYQWNKGISYCKGDLIWIAESDDFAHSDFLEKVTKPFEKDSDMVLSYTNSIRVNAERQYIGPWIYRRKKKSNFSFEKSFHCSGFTYMKNHLLSENTIPNASAVIFKKAAYINVGMADASIQKCGDWFLWIKLCMEGNIAYCHETLNEFRQHNNSVIAQAKKNLKKGLFYNHYDIEMRKALDLYLKKQPSTGDIREIFVLNSSLYKKELKEDIAFFLKKGKMGKAISSLQQIIKGL